MTGRPSDYLHLHFLVLIWGFTAILGLLITIPPVEIVFYRTLFSAAGLALVLYFYRIPFKVSDGDVFRILATGVLISGHWILFFASARVSTASVCLAGMATTSFWTSLLEPLMTRRKIKWFELILGLIVLGGLYIIFHFEFNHALGLSFALLSALLAALFTVINSKFVKNHNHYSITFYEMVGACVGTALFFPVYINTLAADQVLRLSINWYDLLYISILAFICTVYAYSASVQLMKRLSAFAVNLTVNLEPVYGIILAVIIFGDREKMQTEFYLGASIILVSVLAYPLFNKWYHRKYLETETLR